MDNLSHTLAGLVVAEAASEHSAATSTKRTLLFVASVLANNFPDLDILYSNIAPAPLGYLLHHRGHTHTLGGAAVEVMLILTLLFLIPAFRRELGDRSTLKLTAGVVATGLTLHLTMDSWNTYGVHPLWPLSSRWFFGDTVFIIEPFVWTGLAVPLLFVLPSRVSKVLMALVIGIVPLVGWYGGLLSSLSLGLIAVFSLVMTFAAKAVRTRQNRLILAVVAVTNFVLLQHVASSQMRKRIRAKFHAETPTHRILEIITNPAPANPLCWNVIRLEADPARDLYRVITFSDLFLPKEWGAFACPRLRPEPLTVERSLRELRTAYDVDCQLEAWLRFARAPLLTDGTALDLRFASGFRGNFTRLSGAGTKRPCPPLLPGWEHPRKDLIDLSHESGA